MATVLPPPPQISSTKPTRKGRVSFDTPQIAEGFAFARVNGKVHLVLLSRASTNCQYTITVHIFRHEFISIFRLDTILTDLDPTDGSLRILEPIASDFMRYEEENETVFLAKDLTLRLAKLADPMSPGRPGIPGLFGPPATRRTRY
ncbi:hypothetical protein DL96DRAFT_1610151 [Flagelloscypha sp. PMI_526]|nr:hypothetical protein DL96DRAFT_1610151 [Flagelloscypha sp. PMI_526]